MRFSFKYNEKQPLVRQWQCRIRPNGAHNEVNPLDICRTVNLWLAESRIL